MNTHYKTLYKSLNEHTCFYVDNITITAERSAKRSVLTVLLALVLSIPLFSSIVFAGLIAFLFAPESVYGGGIDRSGEYRFGFTYASVYEEVPDGTPSGFFLHNGFDAFFDKFTELNNANFKMVDLELLAGDGILKVASVYMGTGKTTIKTFSNWQDFARDFLDESMTLTDVERWLDVDGKEYFTGLYHEGESGALILHRDFDSFVKFKDDVIKRGYYLSDVEFYRTSDGQLRIISTYELAPPLRVGSGGAGGQLFYAKQLFGGLDHWYDFYHDLPHDKDYRDIWGITDFEAYYVTSGLVLDEDTNNVLPAHFNPKYLGVFHEVGVLAGETSLGSPYVGVASNSILHPLTGWPSASEVLNEFDITLNYAESDTDLPDYALKDIELCFLPHFTAKDYRLKEIPDQFYIEHDMEEELQIKYQLKAKLNEPLRCT